MTIRHRKSDARPSATDEIREVLLDADGPLTAAEVFKRCQLVPSPGDVSKILWTLHNAGSLERSMSNTGRYAYVIKNGAAPVEADPAESEQDEPLSANPLGEAMQQALAPVTRVLKRQSRRRGAPPVEDAPVRRSGFELGRRIEAIVADIEEALGDAIDSDQPKELVKALVAANGATNRAARLIQREVTA